MCRNIWHAFGFCFAFFMLFKNILKIRLLCIFEKQISHFSTKYFSSIWRVFRVCMCVFCFDKYLATQIFTLIALTSVGILEIHLELPAVGQSANAATRRMINKLIKIYCATLEKILLNSTNSLARSPSLLSLSLSFSLCWQFAVRQSCRSMVVSTV